MCNQHGQNQQCDAGPNPTALLRNFDADARQAKDESLAHHRETANLEEKLCYGCGPGLEPIDEFLQEQGRKGNSKQEKGERKPRTAAAFSAKQEQKAGHKQQNQGKNRHGQARSAAVCKVTPRYQQQRGKGTNHGGQVVRLNRSWHFLLLDKQKPGTDKWNEENVRGVLVIESGVPQIRNRLPKQEEARCA